MTVANPSQIAISLRKEYWDNKLVDESLQQDILSQLTTVFDGTQDIPIPKDALVLQTAIPDDGSRQVNLGFLHALNQPGGEGDLFVQIGNEEQLRQRSMIAYHNEFSHAVTGFQYGIHYYEARPYGVYDENMSKATQLLGNHAYERMGLYRRQGLLETFSQNLTQSPLFLNQVWNPHFYVKNLFDNQQPAYTPNNATYTQRIAGALATAGVGINAALDAHFLLALSNRAKQLRIEPLMFNGKKRYIFTVPSEQKVWFNSLNISGSGGSWMSQYSAKSSLNIEFDGFWGEWQDIILVEDERAPTLTLGGSAGSYTLTAGYMMPGNNDQRDTSAGARQVGYLLGKGPLVERYPEKIHHETDDFNYQKWMGKGYFGMIGDTLRRYDNLQNRTANTMQQNSSIVCVFARNAMYN